MVFPFYLHLPLKKIRIILLNIDEDELQKVIFLSHFAIRMAIRHALSPSPHLGALKRNTKVFVLYLSVGIICTRKPSNSCSCCSISFIYSPPYVYRNIPLQYTVLEIKINFSPLLCLHMILSKTLICKEHSKIPY